jgi:predicted RND superfamily exporter protein
MSIAPIKSVSHFAVYSAVGVVAAFLLSLTLLVVFLSFGRRRLPREASEAEKIRAKGGRLFHAALAGVARFDVRHRRAILALFAGIFVLSAFGIARLRVDSNFLNEFSEDEPIRIATEYVDEIMGGTYSFVYLFDSGVAEGVKSPEFLRDVERLQAQADGHADLVKKSYSIADLLKDINKSFHEEDPAHYVLPETRDLAAQYLLLYEMSGGEELEDFISGDFARASLELRCKAVESSVLAELTDKLNTHLEAHPVSSASVSVTGIGALWLRLMTYITQSQIRGFLLAFSVIAALMCFVFQSLKTGLLAMVPNLSPVVLTLGVMGWLDMPLDYVRLLIATVAIGIAVDDTIHHMTRFRYEFLRSGSYEQALEASTVDVGRALVITSVALVAGFLVFLLSSLDSMASFGILLATTISVALVADFFLMPALVLTLKPWGPGR